MFAAQIDHSNDDFSPYLSAETVNFHYGKHHVGYANNLNVLIKDSDLKKMSLENIIISTRGQNTKIFNNAAQLFNHNFYWKCLKKDCGQPTGQLKNMIDKQFGSFENFREEYSSFANTMFGSGWSWLVKDEDELKFYNTANAETPVGTPYIPLCVIDLWEHAYYIDYRNDRAEYIKQIMNCINWNFCESLI